MEKIIEVSGLKKSYGSLQAVKGLDFYVEKGKLFAFLGPNGAGKSTTIDILCTLGNYDDGEVTIAGYSPRKSPEEIRRRIGVVFQDSLLDKTLRVRDNLQLRAGFYYRKKAELDNAVRKAAQSAEAEAFLNRPYGKLSGGQRRRADIARALLSSPEILFLDEPTTGLDPQTRRHVWKTIRRLQREQGMTIFLTTHYMEEAEAADYSIILDNGLIAAITSGMGAYAVMVSDKESRREKDFLCAPLKGWEITGGYLLPGMAVSFLMSLVTLVFVCLYLAVSGFSLPRAGLLLPLAGIMLLTSFAASAMTCFITSFLKTVNAYTTVSILLGTLTGFLLGAYVNIGSLPSGVQTLIRFFPLSHSAVLYRQLLMQDALDQGFASFSGPWQEIFCENMGVTYAVNGSPMQPWMHLCVLAATGAAFYALALLRLSFAARPSKGKLSRPIASP